MQPNQERSTNLHFTNRINTVYYEMEQEHRRFFATPLEEISFKPILCLYFLLNSVYSLVKKKNLLHRNLYKNRISIFVTDGYLIERNLFSFKKLK